NFTEDGIVLRPDTYVVDTRFSTGTAENFVELYVDPETLPTSLTPSSPPPMPEGPKGAMTTAPSFPPTGSLLLVNKRLTKTDVTISGVTVGRIHPLTEASIHGVRWGCYEVTWAYPDDSSATEQVCTVASLRPANPGGPSAAVYLEEGRPDRDEPEWRYGPPDRDRDGVADSDDECPDEAGPESSFGCPDGDADRVPDYRDDCPDKAGPAKADPRRSDGCPARVFVAAESIEITEKIYFQTNRSRIKPESYDLLDEIAAILNAHDEIKLVEIAGHTDSQGRDAYNLKLSDARAHAVKDYLVAHGVDESRLVAKGYGETQPKADNDTEEGRAMNRRVEFRILEQDVRMIEQDADEVGPPEGPEENDTAAPPAE
ncbi:MAG: OmpA family protein, partial [Deltaproteobacteria bacterium]